MTRCTIYYLCHVVRILYYSNGPKIYTHTHTHCLLSLFHIGRIFHKVVIQGMVSSSEDEFSMYPFFYLFRIVWMKRVAHGNSGPQNTFVLYLPFTHNV